MKRADPVAEIDAVLERIAALDGRLRTFITVDADEARRAARTAAAQRKAGPLAGRPIAIKDNIDTAGLRTTAGTAIHRDRVPTDDATVVERLRAADLVIVGKTNMTELACGTIGGNPHYGDVRNPHDATCWPGGSSSGSAAAVAAGLVPLALGTDTSCSIRYPAAVCGVIGLKPTWGRVSNRGVGVCARQADHLGLLTTSVGDAAALLTIIQDDGWSDPTAAIGLPVAGLRAGVLEGPFINDCGADVIASFEAAVARLRLLGMEADSWDPAIDLDEADDALNTLCVDLIEAYGQVLAASPDKVGTVLGDWLTVFERSGPGERDRALNLREQLRAKLATAFDRFDVLLCPTARRPAGPYTASAMADRGDRSANCSLFGFTGLPALSVPMGPAATGMPLGLQVIAADGRDEMALRVAAAFHPGTVELAEMP